MSRASRRANRESARRANNDKVINSANKGGGYTPTDPKGKKTRMELLKKQYGVIKSDNR